MILILSWKIPNGVLWEVLRGGYRLLYKGNINIRGKFGVKDCMGGVKECELLIGHLKLVFVLL